MRPAPFGLLANLLMPSLLSSKVAPSVAPYGTASDHCQLIDMSLLCAMNQYRPVVRMATDNGWLVANDVGSIMFVSICIYVVGITDRERQESRQLLQLRLPPSGQCEHARLASARQQECEQRQLLQVQLARSPVARRS